MSSDLDLIYGKQPTSPDEKTEVNPASQPTVQSTGHSTSQSTNKPVKTKTNTQVSKTPHQLVSRSTDRPVSRQTSRPPNNKIVDRPKAFYILERIDRNIDKAVRYLQDTHGIKKADRSTVVNAYLDDDALWSEEAVDRLVDRVISQLTSRLTEK